MEKSRLLGAVCACIACIPTSVIASFIYSYTGNNYSLIEGSETTITNPYDTTMSLSMDIELASQIGANFLGDISPISYSFFDGVNTITNTNSSNPAITFRFSTNASGLIDGWTFALGTGSLAAVGDSSAGIITMGADPNGLVSISSVDITGILYCNDIASSGFCDTNTTTDHRASILENRGTWSVSEVPVPAAVWIFGSGLLGLIGIARHKKAA